MDGYCQMRVLRVYIHDMKSLLLLASSSSTQKHCNACEEGLSCTLGSSIT